jgi:hypothetical protein
VTTLCARGALYALLTCLAVAADHAAAAPAPALPELELRIAAQPLDAALREFARQSGVQVVFFSHVTEGRSSRGVSGVMSLERALEALLAGTGLNFRIVNPRTVEIFRSAATMLGCCGG